MSKGLLSKSILADDSFGFFEDEAFESDRFEEFSGFRGTDFGRLSLDGVLSTFPSLEFKSDFVGNAENVTLDSGPDSVVGNFILFDTEFSIS